MRLNVDVSWCSQISLGIALQIPSENAKAKARNATEPKSHRAKESPIRTARPINRSPNNSARAEELGSRRRTGLFRPQPRHPRPVHPSRANHDAHRPELIQLREQRSRLRPAPPPGSTPRPSGYSKRTITSYANQIRTLAPRVAELTQENEQLCINSPAAKPSAYCPSFLNPGLRDEGNRGADPGHRPPRAAARDQMPYRGFLAARQWSHLTVEFGADGARGWMTEKP